MVVVGGDDDDDDDDEENGIKVFILRCLGRNSTVIICCEDL